MESFIFLYIINNNNSNNNIFFIFMTLKQMFTKRFTWDKWVE